MVSFHKLAWMKMMRDALLGSCWIIVRPQNIPSQNMMPALPTG